MDYDLTQSVLLNSEINLSDTKYESSQRVVLALLKEICLSPKPGLVDFYNTGSHCDMNFNTFITSIKAISPWFDEFYQYGQLSVTKSKRLFLSGIRPIGVACENAMLNATSKVNTHKGGIFAFGLLLGAIGRLTEQGKQQNWQSICNEVANRCQGITYNELIKTNTASTIGEKLFKLHNLSGARGEAESGYQTVRNISLPIFINMINRGYSEELSLLEAMLYLLAHNNDTNLVARGGLEGLTFVQNAAKELIRKGGILHKNSLQSLHQLDTALISRNLSPGGTADLIAVTWFLAQYQ